MKKRSFFNRQTIAIAWVMVILLTATPAMVRGQDSNPGVFAVVEYMKVKQGDEQKYIDLERNYWKKIHQERVDSGEIIRWVLYQVLYSGSDDAYNYVTATIVTDQAKLEYPFEQIEPAKVLPGEDVDRIMQETSDSRQLVKRNLLWMVSTDSDANPPGDFKYLVVNFMKVKPGGGGAYVDVENRIWKPVHQQYVRDGSTKGWSLWQAVYPGGSGTDFQYITTDYYSDFSKVGMADFQGTVVKVHPGKDINQLMQETNDSREHSRSELWRVIEFVP